MLDTKKPFLFGTFFGLRVDGPFQLLLFYGNYRRQEECKVVKTSLASLPRDHGAGGQGKREGLGTGGARE